MPRDAMLAIEEGMGPEVEPEAEGSPRLDAARRVLDAKDPAALDAALTEFLDLYLAGEGD